MLTNLCNEENYQPIFPPINLCGDNAAMIALACHKKFEEKIEPNYFDIQIPPLEPGELFSLSDLEMTVYGFDFANSIIGNLNDSEGNNILKVKTYIFSRYPIII